MRKRAGGIDRGAKSLLGALMTGGEEKDIAADKKVILVARHTELVYRKRA